MQDQLDPVSENPAEDCLTRWNQRPEVRRAGYWEALQENCTHWAETASVCRLWKKFESSVQDWSAEFRKSGGGQLLANDTLPTFFPKGVARIRSKLQQMTGIQADELLERPGPVPDLNDLVRTRVECVYLDGVEFLAKKLERAAMDVGALLVWEKKGSLEGYFAQHLVFHHLDHFHINNSDTSVNVRCEIQVATRLATTMWNESHRVYEQWRGREEDTGDWQWNAKDPRFITRQLGHMMHLADGLLVQLRDAATVDADKAGEGIREKG